jgi:hypothetical protein
VELVVAVTAQVTLIILLQLREPLIPAVAVVLAQAHLEQMVAQQKMLAKPEVLASLLFGMPILIRRQPLQRVRRLWLCLVDIEFIHGRALARLLFEAQAWRTLHS